MSKEYILDCEEMYERKQTHEYIAEVLEFPDYYGKNLDALFDCLTEMGECSVIFTNLDALSELGDYSGALLAVFEEAEQVNEDLTLIYEDSDYDNYEDSDYDNYEGPNDDNYDDSDDENCDADGSDDE